MWNVPEDSGTLASGCKTLTGKQYLERHDKALMVFTVEWCKQEGILDEKTPWYTERWEKGTVLERGSKKRRWNFEVKLRKTERARRPDFVLEDGEEKVIWLVDQGCPMEENIAAKYNEKLRNYQKYAFEMRERRPDYKVQIVPLIIGCLGGGGDYIKHGVEQSIRKEGWKDY